MAQIYKQSNEMEQELVRLQNIANDRVEKINKSSSKILIVAGFLLAIACLLHNNRFSYIILPVALTCFLAYLALKLNNNGWDADLLAEANIIQAGMTGENITASVIESLPDDYVAFRNLHITYEGKQSEIDLFVVGPTGAFVIETKYLNGAIVGDLNGNEWIQEKIGRAGTPYGTEFYNPVKQVKTHIYRLANFLRLHNFHVYLDGIVFFSNDQVFVRLTGENSSVPVFCISQNGEQLVKEYILNHPRKVPAGELDRLVEFLKKH